MILQYLTAEFESEVNITHKLLQAVPEKDLSYRPSKIPWTMGELAQHVATIYYWYVGALTEDVYDLGKDALERGDTNDIKATLTEQKLQDNWTMKFGERNILGPMSRGIVTRGFLFNHIYHHRGELIVYLRTTGNKVPGMFGPTYEESGKT